MRVDASGHFIRHKRRAAFAGEAPHFGSLPNQVRMRLFAAIALFLLATLQPEAIADTLTPTTKILGPAALRYEIFVNATGAWTASANVPWVSVTPSSGGGQWNVTVSVQTNATGVSRQATLTIAGISHTLTQNANAAGSGSDLCVVGSNSAGQLGLTNVSRTSPVHVSTDIAATAAGESHTMILKKDGTLWAVGSNAYGQLGDGTTTARVVPFRVASDVVSVAAGAWHTAFVKANGTLWVMGVKDYSLRQGGAMSLRTSPAQVASGVVTVAAGSRHIMFVKTNGTLWGLGDNFSRQLGAGRSDFETDPVQVATGVASVAAGGSHSVFLKTDGTLWAMGANASGQLGDGTDYYRPTPVQVATGVTVVAAGYEHTAFVKNDGTLWTVGRNDFGQLADGTTADRVSPQQVASGVASIAAGFYHTLFVKTDGALWVAGSDLTGQLGAGRAASANSFRPTPVEVANGVASVSAGAGHSVWVKTDGTLWATGETKAGQLADGTYAGRAVPMAIATGVASVATGSSHTMFVKTDGTLWAMGSNNDGELCNGGASSLPLAMTRVASNVAAVAAGTRYSLFVKTDGTLWAAGYNDYGQLGNGGTYNPLGPVQIASDVASVAAGNSHTLFVKTDGTLWATGYNDYGQLGDGTVTTRTVPVQVASGVASVAAGYRHTMFVKTDGTLWAMGQSTSGQLGIETTDYGITVPVQVASGVSSVAAGDYHTAFVKTDGTLWTMGQNAYRQPVLVASGVKAVAARSSFTLFVKTDGTLWKTAVGARSELVANGVVGLAAGFDHFAYLVDSSRATPTVSWSTPPSITYGTGLSDKQLNASSDVAGTMIYSHETGAILGAGTHILTATFTPADTSTYSAAVAIVTLLVEPMPVSITLGNTTALYDGTQKPVSVTTEPSGVATFVTYSGESLYLGTVAPTQPGIYSVWARVADAVNYTGVANGTLEIIKNFNGWSMDYFSSAERLDAAISGLDADPDGDGLDNLAEYALGLSPKAANTAGSLPSLNVTGADWIYTYARPDYRPDLSYNVEVSPNLTDWTTEGVTHERVSTTGGVETWRATYPRSTTDRVFFRLNVTR